MSKRVSLVSVCLLALVVTGCTASRPPSYGLPSGDSIVPGVEYTVGKIPFMAIGKAIAAGEPDGFAKLLYGSKFHSRKQQRGQQGIGISASVMYGQLTTGRPAKIISKIGKDDPTREELRRLSRLGLNLSNNMHKYLEGDDIQSMAQAGLGLAVLEHSLPGDMPLFSRADLDAFAQGERDVSR